MDTVRVRREELLTLVKKNRDNHRAVFEKAQETYRERMIKELDSMIADAKAGRRIRRHISMPEPEDHTGDYDRILRMLEMSVDETLELSEYDFSRYVMDQWEWAESFAVNTLSYVKKR
jgi:hypothetical protein